MGTIKSKHIYKKYLFWILPVCAVLLSAVLLQSLLWRKQTEFREIAPVNGILDITELDLPPKFSYSKLIGISTLKNFIFQKTSNQVIQIKKQKRTSRQLMFLMEHTGY